MASPDTTSARASLWLAGEAPARSAPLIGTAEADAAVVGGGIAGVTTALRLQRAGVRTTLLEAEAIGSGVTGNTTAKVSALQGTVYTTIASRHGAETAQAYACASTAAVADVAEFVAGERIDCALARRPAVTYAADADELAAVRREFAAASEAGLPVRFSDHDAGLPYPVAGAIWLEDQIGFHPVRYVRGLAAAFVAAGGTLHESSRVRTVRDGAPCRIFTDYGELRAPQVVIATHYPILDRGLFFARMKAQRSYCIAARVRDPLPQVMAINAGDPTRSVQVTDRELIIGGESHVAGARDASEERFATLESFAAAHWHAAEPVARWSAQDPVPYDHLPMVGPLVPRSERLFVATGWAKWGLTGGTFAARILTEAILGREHEWAPFFSPTRVSLRSLPEVAELGTTFATLMVRDRVVPADAGSAEEVAPGEGRILRDGRDKVGAFRDEDGVLHCVSLRCTHLGCLLRFNAAERSWDCPCHGSRFDVDGGVLEGPAVNPLERRAVGG